LPLRVDHLHLHRGQRHVEPVKPDNRKRLFIGQAERLCILARGKL